MHHFMTGEYALGQLKIRLLMKAVKSNNQAPEFEVFFHKLWRLGSKFTIFVFVALTASSNVFQWLS